MWTHGLAALMFGALVLWELRLGRPADDQRLLMAALALTCCWAWLTAVAPETLLASYAETARNIFWIGVLYRLADPSQDDERQRGVRPVYMAVAGVLGMQLLVDALTLFVDTHELGAMDAIGTTSIILRITAAAGTLVLIHNLYGQAAPASRGGIRLAMLGLAAMFAYDLNLYTFAYFDRELGEPFFLWRGLAVAVAAPLFALGRAQRDSWRIRLSRAATFQSLSLLAICAYFATMAILVTVLKGSGIEWRRSLAVLVLAVMTLSAMVILPSGRARGWAKVKIAKHFFEHRYDYRSEWLRFTGTLGATGADSAPLAERIIRAFADIVDAPGGILVTIDDSGAIDPIARWNWRGAPLPGEGAARETLAQFWRAVAREGRVVDFEARRNGWADGGQAERAVPADLLAETQAWLGVPLIHEERLVALLILSAPGYRRPLDWEDYDLLRTAGRQAASNLAEHLGQAALADAQRFDDFNRRFAFILHDVKNLVSQLSLLSRNAERHADNPEFRADMVATLKGSVGKMNDLLQRIAPQRTARPVEPRAVALLPLLSALLAGKRGAHEVELRGDADLWVMADEAALEQAIGHLVQNAIDASPAGAPVAVRVDDHGANIRVSVIDEGHGMDADFVRHRLFQPFASTKDGGFGIGAYEARSLIAAMGGRLAVESRPGEGTKFTITLRSTEAPPSRKRA